MMTVPLVWRKSTFSGPEANCVEVGRPDTRWLKSSRSTGSNTCVELGHTGAVRDSKNPTGPALRVDLPVLLAAVKDGRLS